MQRITVLRNDGSEDMLYADTARVEDGQLVLRQGTNRVAEFRWDAVVGYVWAVAKSELPESEGEGDSE